MQENKSIKKNILMSIILTTSNFLFPLITYSYVARILTPAGTGKVAFVQSTLSYFSHIAMLGIPSYGLRECARVRDNKKDMSHLVQELLILNLAFTLLAYILLVLSILLVPKLQEYRELFLVMGGSILLSTIGLEWVYQAIEEYTYITIRSLMFKCLSVALTFALIQSKEDSLWYGFLVILTDSASYLLNFINIKKHICFQKERPYQFRRHLKPIWTFFMVSVVITIYANFDVSMLGFLKNDYEVGLYSAASKIKNIILSLSTAVTSVLVPRIGYYMQKNVMEKVEDLLEKSLRISLLLCVPVTIYTILFSEQVLQFLCGHGFLSAGPSMRILTLCVIPLVLTNLFGNQILIPLGREDRYSQSVFIGMWINLVLNSLLIPLLGAAGAAVGTLATECWNVFWMSKGVPGYRKMLAKNVKLRRYLIPMIVAACVSVVIGNLVTQIPVFFQLAISAIVFFAVYYGLLLLMQEPLLYEQIMKIVHKIKNRFAQ